MLNLRYIYLYRTHEEALSVLKTTDKTVRELLQYSLEEKKENIDDLYTKTNDYSIKYILLQIKTQLQMLLNVLDVLNNKEADN